MASHHLVPPLLAVCCFAWPLVCSADTKLDLARKYVEVLRYDEQFEQVRESCLASPRTLPLESFLSPEELKSCGIKPGSKEWGVATREYEGYYAKVCSRPTREEFLESLASAYREQLSTAELQAAIDFYSTSAGAKLVRAHKLASARVTEVIAKGQALQVPSAVAEFQRKLQAIGQGAHKGGGQ